MVLGLKELIQLC